MPKLNSILSTFRGPAQVVASNSPAVPPGLYRSVRQLSWRLGARRDVRAYSTVLIGNGLGKRMRHVDLTDADGRRILSMHVQIAELSEAAASR